MAVKTKLLFVDDDPFILGYLDKLFGEQYDIVKASNGLEGLEFKKQHKVRIIYTDLQMPKMNGIEMCKKMRENDPISIVCAFTGQKGLFQLMEVREAGFDDFLLKPFNEELLINSVCESVSRMNRWLGSIEKR